MVGEGIPVPLLLLCFPSLEGVALQSLFRCELGGIHGRMLALIGFFHLAGGVVADDAFARRLSEMPKLARQFHLSMQSGSAGVLKRMNRRYTPEEYLSACDTLRKYMPGCAITTDVIAGFPGETGEEFAETEAFIQRVNFARIHVFPYSRRSGTRADRMENQVPENIKHERTQKLIQIGNKMEESYV